MIRLQCLVLILLPIAVAWCVYVHNAASGDLDEWVFDPGHFQGVVAQNVTVAVLLLVAAASQQWSPFRKWALLLSASALFVEFFCLVAVVGSEAHVSFDPSVNLARFLEAAICGGAAVWAFVLFAFIFMWEPEKQAEPQSKKT